MEDVRIIENTEQAKKEYGYQWGYDELELTEEMLNALKDGKCVACDGGEYVTYITLKKC